MLGFGPGSAVRFEPELLEPSRTMVRCARIVVSQWRMMTRGVFQAAWRQITPLRERKANRRASGRERETIC